MCIADVFPFLSSAHMAHISVVMNESGPSEISTRTRRRRLLDPGLKKLQVSKETTSTKKEYRNHRKFA